MALRRGTVEVNTFHPIDEELQLLEGRVFQQKRRFLHFMCKKKDHNQIQQVFVLWSHLCCRTRRRKCEQALEDRQKESEMAFRRAERQQKEVQQQWERREQFLLQQSSELQELENLMDNWRQKQVQQSHVLREGVLSSLLATSKRLHLLFALSNWRSILKRKGQIRNMTDRLAMRFLLLRILSNWATVAASATRQRNFEEYSQLVLDELKMMASSLTERALLREDATCLQSVFQCWLLYAQHSHALEGDITEIVGAKVPRPSEVGDPSSNVGDLLIAAASVVEERVLWFWEPLLSAILLFWQTFTQSAALEKQLEKQRQQKHDAEYQQSLQRFRQLQDLEGRQLLSRQHARSAVKRLISDGNFYVLEAVICAWKVQAESRQGGFPLATPASTAGWNFGEDFQGSSPSPSDTRSPWRKGWTSEAPLQSTSPSRLTPKR